MTDRITPASKTTACPTCQTPVAEGHAVFPFCSPRCQTIDLGRWFNEDYKVTRPIEQSDIEEGE